MARSSSGVDAAARTWLGATAALLVACGGGVTPGMPAGVTDGAFAWEQIDGPRDGEQVRDLAVLPDGRAWVAGERLRYFDGAAWMDVALPESQPGASDFIRTIAVRTANDVWFAGSRLLRFNGRVVRDHTDFVSAPAAGQACDAAMPAGGRVPGWAFCASSKGVSFGRLDAGGFVPMQGGGLPTMLYAGMAVLDDRRLVVPGNNVYDDMNWQPWAGFPWQSSTDDSRTAWAVHGTRVFSLQAGQELEFTVSEPPAAFSVVARLPPAELPCAVNSYTLGTMLKPVAVVPLGESVYYALECAQAGAFFVEVRAGAARLTGDTFAASPLARAVPAGAHVWAVTVDGAVFRGVRP